MSSRQEEKERRRQERLAAEQREAKAAERRKRIQYAFGGLLAVAAIAAIVILVSSAGGGDAETETSAGTSAASADLPELPAAQEDDWQKAAQKAGCKLINPPFDGSGHVEGKEFTKDDFKTSPPVSGDHSSTPAQDGIYAPGNAPGLGDQLHAMEHGRIILQYRAGAPEDVAKNLEALYAEANEGYHLLLLENNSDMEYEVAATAWTHILGCPEYNDRVPDAIRTFTARYLDQGPEKVP